MQLLAAALEQTVVGGVANQGVLEGISRIRGCAAAVNEFGVLELRERVLKQRIVKG